MGGGGGGDNGMMMMMTIMMMQSMQQMQQQQQAQIDAQQTAQTQKQVSQVQSDVQANTWDMLRQYGQSNSQQSATAGNMTNPTSSFMSPTPAGAPPLLTAHTTGSAAPAAPVASAPKSS